MKTIAQYMMPVVFIFVVVMIGIMTANGGGTIKSYRGTYEIPNHPQ